MSTHATSLSRTLAGALIVALGVSACATPAPQDTATSTAPSPVAAAAPMSTSTPPAGVAPLGDASLDVKTLRPNTPSNLVVTGVRVGSHQGFDRVVFDFHGQGQPGWFVDYVDSPTQQASGQPLVVEGTSFLNVAIDGTTYPFEAGIEDPSLGPLNASGPIVKQVVPGGTFEGRTQFIVGLHGPRRPYSVQVLSEPTRLVIDISQDATSS